mmetsp:Transcript_111502/g.193256  ORF Transcript_111502/g.193256 Transcript_111502/m.193256 type:complete len:164 (-) Transcript_111502:61-552(-)
MPRRRDPSYSDSGSPEPPPRKRRGRSPSRSPPRRSRRPPSDSRSRSRGRGGRGGGRGGGGGGDDLSEWGDKGVIVDLKGSGFGFIRPDTGKVNDKDLYFHCTAVNKSNPFDELRVNDEVSYEPVRDERKGQPVAKNVQLLNGGSKGKSRKDSRDRDDSRDRRR